MNETSTSLTFNKIVPNELVTKMVGYLPTNMACRTMRISKDFAGDQECWKERLKNLPLSRLFPSLSPPFSAGSLSFVSLVDRVVTYLQPIDIAKLACTDHLSRFAVYNNYTLNLPSIMWRQRCVAIEYPKISLITKIRQAGYLAEKSMRQQMAAFDTTSLDRIVRLTRLAACSFGLLAAIYRALLTSVSNMMDEISVPTMFTISYVGLLTYVPSILPLCVRKVAELVAVIQLGGRFAEHYVLTKAQAVRRYFA